MVRRPPRSTQSGSSAASDVYKRQEQGSRRFPREAGQGREVFHRGGACGGGCLLYTSPSPQTDSYLVCRLLLEKKKKRKPSLASYAAITTKINKYRNYIINES